MQLAWIEDRLREWDPIGSVPPDEYDIYAPAVRDLLAAGADACSVAAHLEVLEVFRMGLPRRPEVDRRIAETLVTGFRERWASDAR